MKSKLLYQKTSFLLSAIAFRCYYMLVVDGHNRKVFYINHTKERELEEAALPDWILPSERDKAADKGKAKWR